jgi:hypothetical protein
MTHNYIIATSMSMISYQVKLWDLLQSRDPGYSKDTAELSSPERVRYGRRPSAVDDCMVGLAVEALSALPVGRPQRICSTAWGYLELANQPHGAPGCEHVGWQVRGDVGKG